MEVLERYEQQQQTLNRLNRWVNRYSTDLIKKEPDALREFQQFVKWLDLQDDKPLENVKPILNGNNCLKVEKLEGDKLNSFISGPSGCTGDDSEQWVYDLKGKIHSKIALDQCLTEQGSWVNLGACSLDSPMQIWEMIGSDQTKQGGKCFDLRTGKLVENRGSLITYNCNGGSNQKWTTLTKNPSFILGTAGNNLPLIADSLQKEPVTMNNMKTRSLSMDSTEEPSVLEKVSTAISN